MVEEVVFGLAFVGHIRTYVRTCCIFVSCLFWLPWLPCIALPCLAFAPNVPIVPTPLRRLCRLCRRLCIDCAGCADSFAHIVPIVPIHCADCADCADPMCAECADCDCADTFAANVPFTYVRTQFMQVMFFFVGAGVAWLRAYVRAYFLGLFWKMLGDGGGRWGA